MLYKIAGFACIAGFLYGYDLGLISGALAPIKADLKASEVSLEIMVGAAKGGAVIGTFLGGALMLHFGRRLTIGFDSLFFIVGPLLMAFSSNMWSLTVGRIIVGLGIGVSAVVVPAYLGEVSPAALRGRIVESYEVMLCLGMLMAMLMDSVLQSMPGNWRWMVGAPVLPAVVLSMALFVLPESPRWLVTRARLDEALAVIHRVYTRSSLPPGAQNSTAEVEQELMELWSNVEKDKAATRERNLQAHQQNLARKASRAWRRLQFGNKGRWHSLKTRDDMHHSSGSPAHSEQVGLERKEGAQGSSIGKPPPQDQPPTGMRPSGSMGDVAQEGMTSSSRVSSAGSDHRHTESELRERRVSASSSASSQGAPEPQLRLAITVPGQEAGADADVQVQLSDPASPLSRSMSKIPSGLPPVRTRSSDGELLDMSPTPPGVAKKSRLPATASHTPIFPVLVRDGFWGVFYDMMRNIGHVAQGQEREALLIALCLAFFNQAMASSSVIYYAPRLIAATGVTSNSAATLLTSTLTAAKMVGVGLGMLLIDSLGRRPLLVWGSYSCSAALLLLFGGVYIQSAAFEILALCAFMLAFNASYAGVFWVLLSELFSMSAKSPAASAATAMLFLAGFIADSSYLSMLHWLGPYCFLIYAGIAALGGLYSQVKVPETKGCTLGEVQELLRGKKHASSAMPVTLDTSAQTRHETASESPSRSNLLPA